MTERLLAAVEEPLQEAAVIVGGLAGIGISL